MIELPRSLADQLLQHARDAAPNEACGVAGVRGSTVVHLTATRNASLTPRVHFTFDDEGYRTIIKTEREGLDVGFYHSHPASPAYPSPTDRREMSQTWPGVLQLLVSLASDPPDIKAYRIDQAGNVTPEALSLLD